MKASPKILALMVALTAGAAGAQGTSSNTATQVTAAGTNITNVATASYTDPSNPTSTTPLTSTSNTVTTVVLPKPSFDITYATGQFDGSGTVTPANNVANSVSASTPVQATVAPGGTYTQAYTVTNTGNTSLTIDLTTALSGKGTTAKITSDKAGNTSITSITVPAGGTATIYTQTTIPATATPGTLYGSTPVGSVAGNGITATSTTDTKNGIATGSTLYENQTVDTSGVPVTTDYPQNTDLQYVAIQPTNAVLNNNPNGSTDGGSTTTVTTTVTPPGTTTTTPGYTTTTTPPVTPPGGGTVPGPTPISIQGDKQIAYPPADGNTTPDTVVFNNTVHSGSSTPDTVTLTPGPLPVGTVLTPGTTTVTDTNGVTWTYTGTGTWTDPKGDTVQFVDPGTGAVTNTVTVPANGSANYQTQVTYPDSNPNAGTTTLDAPKPVTVIITTTSGLNPNVSDTTTDVVMPAAATFGDKSQQTGTAGAYVEDPSKAVGPNNSLPATVTTPGATASFPMTISNTGQYPDSYTLAGTVTIPVVKPDGTTGTQVVPIIYTDSAGNPLAQDSNGNYIVPTVAAGGTADVIATVAVPNNALATGTGTAPTLQQTATGVNSKIVMTDNNDPLPIAPAGKIVVGKFTQTKDGKPAVNTQYAVGNPAVVSTTAPTDGSPFVNNPAGYDGMAGVNPNTSYQPGVNYSYQIIAKNAYNTDIAGFSLKDTLNPALNFVSATCTIFDKTGATYATATAVQSGQDISCPAGTLPQGGSANLTITVNVK